MFITIAKGGKGGKDSKGGKGGIESIYYHRLSKGTETQPQAKGDKGL